MLEYDDVWLMMVLIERSEADDKDESDWKIGVWWWCCCWSKGQSAKDVADRKVKVLKMLLLIERSKCWRCYWSKGQIVEDVVADWKVKVLKMLLIESSKCWRCCCWSKESKCCCSIRLKIEDEDYMMLKKIPMIYRCVTLMMLMMLCLSLLLLLLLMLL